MAWNEPGDNSNKNDQDPWGGRRGGGRQGPPDLDEAFRKLQDSLNGISANPSAAVVRAVAAVVGAVARSVRYRLGYPRRAVAVQRHLRRG